MKIRAAVWIAGCFVLLPSLSRAAEELVIKARIDGPSELVVTTNSLTWKNGVNAKPGRHGGRNDPTYVNGTAWTPVWKKAAAERGVDESEPLAWPVGSLDMEFQLLAVGPTPDVTTIEPVTPPSVIQADGKLIINLPDPEPGSRWYVFSLVRIEKEQEKKP